jgi:ActD protein
MAGKNTAAFGIYTTREAVEEGIECLRQGNFRNEDISVLFPENVGNKDFAHVKASKAPEGASTGAATGGVIGGVLGWLAGLGAIAIPGVGPFIAAGPIMAALAGVGVGGALGGIAGALVGLGIPEYEAKRYEGRIKKGGYLVSIHCDDSKWVSKAKKILEDTGAEDISSTGEAAADYAKTDKPLQRTHVEDRTKI